MKNIENLDKEFMDVTDRDIDMLVPWFLMASYAYDVQEEPILSDATYDKMLRRMIDNWDDINHPNKHYILKDDLETGKFRCEYPKRVKDAINTLKDSCYEK